MNDIRDRIRGCLIGGAAGDALGYEVEFISDKKIRERFGDTGITAYYPDTGSGLALISDDTQMTMFTCAGLMHWKQTGGDMTVAVKNAYLDWLRTQQTGYRAGFAELLANGASGDLMMQPGLYDCRAPGNTCLSALMIRSEEADNVAHDYTARPINGSKGCGGVMRAAPVGLLGDISCERMARESANIAAITHGHPLGYLPAAALSHIVNAIVYSGASPECAVRGAEEMLENVFSANEYTPDMLACIRSARTLAGNSDTDRENIRMLGEGWVGDEALAIAIYCCLRHKDSFSDAVIAAVNHNGDSDSTGAIAGNIMGAVYGYEALDEKWKKDLEFSQLILELADDMAATDKDPRLLKYGPGRIQE